MAHFVKHSVVKVRVRRIGVGRVELHEAFARKRAVRLAAESGRGGLTEDAARTVDRDFTRVNANIVDDARTVCREDIDQVAEDDGRPPGGGRLEDRLFLGRQRTVKANFDIEVTNALARRRAVQRRRRERQVRPVGEQGQVARVRNVDADEGLARRDVLQDVIAALVGDGRDLARVVGEVAVAVHEDANALHARLGVHEVAGRRVHVADLVLVEVVPDGALQLARPGQHHAGLHRVQHRRHAGLLADAAAAAGPRALQPAVLQLRKVVGKSIRAGGTGVRHRWFVRCGLRAVRSGVKNRSGAKIPQKVRTVVQALNMQFLQVPRIWALRGVSGRTRGKSGRFSGPSVAGNRTRPRTGSRGGPRFIRIGDRPYDAQRRRTFRDPRGRKDTRQPAQSTPPPRTRGDRPPSWSLSRGPPAPPTGRPRGPAGPRSRRRRGSSSR